MSDTRDAFQNLQSVTGRGFDATALRADWDDVERRIARYRAGRVVLSSFVALAVVSGVTFAAMAMPFGGDASPAIPASATPSATPSPATADPSDEARTPDVGPTREPSMSVFGEPYPDGMSAPNLVELLPGGQGGTYISETDTTYTFGLLRPDPTDGHTVAVPVHFPKGNVIVLAAIHWQCAWITEYVHATESGSAERASAAAAELEKFPNLDVIQQYNPQLGEAYRGDPYPVDLRIADGDIEFAQRWLDRQCLVGQWGR